MSNRPNKHPNKDIQKAVEYAQSKGWTFEKSGKSSHAWAIMKCPYNDNSCRCGNRCKNSIYSTPRSPTNRANQIYRDVDGCIRLQEENKN